MSIEKDSNFAVALKGETLLLVTGAAVGLDRVDFHARSGRRFSLYHSQDCCESVNIESVEGDLAQIIGVPILEAIEDISSENPPGVKREYQDSFTWTTFTLRTEKGSVVIRWYGESNGYYSESVSFVEAR